MRIHIKHQQAFTLIEIMIVFGIITLLVAVGLPGWVKAREKARSTTCQENLQKIDQAKELWALNTNSPTGQTVTFAELVTVGRQGYLQRTPDCPGNGDYDVKNVGEIPECSIGSNVAYSAPPHILP